MPQFCVAMQEDSRGNHVVHREGCPDWPPMEFTRLLGLYDYCDDALRSARAFFHHVDGCSHCILQCNSQLQIRELLSQAEP